MYRQVIGMSMLSLTAQWIDCDFKRKVLLHALEFTGSHTSLVISQAFTGMLDRCKIDRSRVHAVVRDNVRNMAKAMMDSDIMSLPCMAHSLHLGCQQRHIKPAEFARIGQCVPKDCRPL